MIFKRRSIGGSPLEVAAESGRKVIRVTSPAFEDGERIPDKYTCTGFDISPPLRIENVPEDVGELALIMFDPDAPIGIFYHWLLYNVSPAISELPEGVPGEPKTEYGYQGFNDFGRIGYGGPCPPRGHGVHHYHFLVIGVKGRLGLEPKIRPKELLGHLRGRVSSYGLLIGTYSR